MNREIQAVVLLLVGAVALRLSLTDAYLNYVNQTMKPWLIGAGAMLLALGIAALVDVVRGRGQHDHHHHGPRSAWLLLIPVATVFLVAPPALGAYSAARDTTNAVTPSEKEVAFDPLPPGEPVQLMVSDYVSRAVWGNGTSLEGRTVELTGFVVPSSDGQSWALARMMMSCCAADATASKVLPRDLPMAFQKLEANTWVTVTGTYLPNGQEPSAKTIPWLKVTSITETKKPKNPYE